MMFCKLLWHFDLELCDEEKDWIEGQRTFLAWEVPALNIKVTAANES